MNRKLLIFDIDETLISASDDELDDYDFTIDVDYETLYVRKRPGLDDLLKWSFQHFQVAFWSASHIDYVRQILVNILPPMATPLFCWGGDRCTTKYQMEGLHAAGRIVIKDLKKLFRRRTLGFNRQNVLTVDDTPSTYCRNYGNAIPISKFTGNCLDSELKKLKQKLMRLITSVDVRTEPKSLEAE